METLTWSGLCAIATMTRRVCWHRTAASATSSTVYSKGGTMRGDHNGLGRDLPPGAPLPNLPRGLVVAGVRALIGISLLWTTFYTVEADEVAVVRRFGKYVRREEPGLHLKLPLRMETVRPVK